MRSNLMFPGTAPPDPPTPPPLPRVSLGIFPSPLKYTRRVTRSGEKRASPPREVLLPPRASGHTAVGRGGLRWEPLGARSRPHSRSPPSRATSSSSSAMPAPGAGLPGAGPDLGAGLPGAGPDLGAGLPGSSASFPSSSSSSSEPRAANWFLGGGGKELHKWTHSLPHRLPHNLPHSSTAP